MKGLTIGFRVRIKICNHNLENTDINNHYMGQNITVHQKAEIEKNVETGHFNNHLG